jgi:hypothetical protein
MIFSVARFGVPSRVESMCLGDPRLESTFSSSSSVSVVFFLGERCGLPCSFTPTGVLPKYHRNFSSECWMEVPNKANKIFPPHPSCTYLKHILIIQFPKTPGDPGKVCWNEVGYYVNVAFFTILGNLDNNTSS